MSDESFDSFRLHGFLLEQCQKSGPSEVKLLNLQLGSLQTVRRCFLQKSRLGSNEHQLDPKDYRNLQKIFSQPKNCPKLEVYSQKIKFPCKPFFVTQYFSPLLTFAALSSKILRSSLRMSWFSEQMKLCV